MTFTAAACLGRLHQVQKFVEEAIDGKTKDRAGRQALGRVALGVAESLTETDFVFFCGVMSGESS